MKKFKLLPSLIMLVLCVGVLAVGVFALNPISNSIAGTISISAGKASLAITGYVDNAVVYPRTELHGGMDWTISSGKLNFDASNYFFPEQVPSKEIKLVIENLSNAPYGVFFCDTAGVNATASNIKTSGEVKSSSDSSKIIINATMDYYKYISKADSSTTLDQVEMTITLSVANISTSAQSGSFKYYLNVEEYNADLNTSEEFIKIDDNLTSINASAYANNEAIKNIIIPSTITSIGANAFSGCTALTEIIIPNSVQTISAGAFANCTSFSEIIIPASVTTIGAGVFDGCSNLQKIIVEAHSTTGDFGGSANLPTISGFSWYLNDEHQTNLAYSTDMNVYTLGEEVSLNTRNISATIEYTGTSLITSGVTVLGTGEYEIGETVTFSICIPGVDNSRVGEVTIMVRESEAEVWDYFEILSYKIAEFQSPAIYSFTLEEDSPTAYIFRVGVEAWDMSWDI